MLNKIRGALSRQRRAERAERRQANREASTEFRNHLASDASTGAIRQGLGNRTGTGRN